jgi:hypothetical protein
VGRLALFANIDTVRNRIRRIFNEIQRFGTRQKMRDAGLDLLGTAPHVFVIGSLAGGTGSGTFFDVSILCRALGGRGWFYTGVFVLPWIYEGIAINPSENAYAALSELEALNKSSIQSPFSVRYGLGARSEFKLEEEPYHVVNLVDGLCASRQRILNPDQLTSFIGECVYHTVGAIGEKLRSVTDNIIKLKIAVPPTAWQRPASYSTFGVSSIVYPYLEIHQRASLNLAMDLIQESLAKRGGEDAAPDDGAFQSDCQAFLVANGLEPGQLITELIPPARIGSYQPGGDAGGSPTQLQAQAKSSVEQWIGRRLVQIQKTIEENGKAKQGKVDGALTTFIDGIKRKELQRELPLGSLALACAALKKLLKDCQNTVIREREDANAKQADAEEKANNALAALGQAKRIWGFRNPGTGTQLANHAAQKTLALKHTAENTAREEAVRLYRAWIGKLEDRLTEAGSQAQNREVAKHMLAALHDEFAGERAALRSAELRQRKSLFEVYVGDQGPNGEDVTWHYVGAPPPKAAEIFPEFWQGLGSESLAELGQKSRQTVRQLFLGFAQKKCSPVKDVAVMDIMRTLQERNPEEVREVVETALENATLLLPLDHSQQSGRDQYLRKFTVIGASPLSSDDKAKNFLSQFLPSHEETKNLWAETGDIHRINFCVYFAVFPLYNIAYLADVRDAYLERVLPPSHSDRNFAFVLQDPIPEHPAQEKVLRLLTLAMLDAVHLIHHERMRPGKSRFRFDPWVRTEVKGLEEEDLELPGAGKFYLLLPAIAKDDARIDTIEALLRKRAMDPAISTQVLRESIRHQKDKFEGRIRGARAGLQKPVADSFSHMISGRLYQRQVDFLRAILKDDTLQSAAAPLLRVIDSLKGT